MGFSLARVGTFVVVSLTLISCMFNSECVALGCVEQLCSRPSTGLSVHEGRSQMAMHVSVFLNSFVLWCVLVPGVW